GSVAEDIAGRYVRQLEPLDEEFRLRPFAAAGWSDEDQSHGSLMAVSGSLAASLLSAREGKAARGIMRKVQAERDVPGWVGHYVGGPGAGAGGGGGSVDSSASGILNCPSRACASRLRTSRSPRRSFQASTPAPASRANPPGTAHQRKPVSQSLSPSVRFSV